jgi:hypothetical protein
MKASANPTYTREDYDATHGSGRTFLVPCETRGCSGSMMIGTDGNGGIVEKCDRCGRRRAPGRHASINQAAIDETAQRANRRNGLCSFLVAPGECCVEERVEGKRRCTEYCAEHCIAQDANHDCPRKRFRTYMRGYMRTYVPPMARENAA